MLMNFVKVSVLAILIIPIRAWAAETAGIIELSWGQLLPPALQAGKLDPKAMARAAHPSNPFGIGTPPSQIPEAPWMSSRSLQPGAELLTAVVPELDGKRVHIGGYVVPLEFDATEIKEFLLVPFVGACIHVPPPPPNQIIYVKAAEAFEAGGQFDPVYVTGTLKTARQHTGLASTGYTIEAAKVDPRKE
jgi:hypothetical protein